MISFQPEQDATTPEPIWQRMMRIPWDLCVAPHMADLRADVVRRHARRFEHRRQMRPAGGGFCGQHVRLVRANRPRDIVEDALMVRPLRKQNRQHGFKRHQPPLNLRPVIVDRFRSHFSSSLVSVSEDYRRRMRGRQLLTLRGPDISSLYTAMFARRQS